MSSTNPIYKGNTPSKPSHRHSSTETNSELARRRFTQYTGEQIYNDGSMHHISYQSTDANVTKAHHNTRMEEQLAIFNDKYSGRS
ncbi:hypothetical protein CGLO_06019 [Colletotrichum gloeosporioides Cg-14]|uniref:Uncharacterized protein n=1 Tax=Colletotrichum gloeosporioides (strain Cg-14) TaxID=1237896 RepID=T0KFH9_COLGC|nr:hypothetical protein CGLO_06019 [Colletotrichum gloeosporioides Cg-14]